MDKEKEKLVIIDYTSLFYSACYNNQGIPEKTDDFKEYKKSLDFYTTSIFEDIEADYYIAVGDGYSSFRKKLYPKTKANRLDRKHSIKFLKDLKEYGIEKYNIIKSEDLEADDICLILHELYKDDFEVIIASKDSDLRQIPAKFYNYGWRRQVYKDTGGQPSKKQLSEAYKLAFEEITEEQAQHNLWKSVLIKGHNNKQHYLTGCGEKTAQALLNNDLPDFAGSIVALQAFIHGIPKTIEGVKRAVKGLGVYKGAIEFGKSFEQSYLLRSLDELLGITTEFDIPEPIPVPTNVGATESEELDFSNLEDF